MTDVTDGQTDRRTDGSTKPNTYTHRQGEILVQISIDNNNYE